MAIDRKRADKLAPLCYERAVLAGTICRLRAELAKAEKRMAAVADRIAQIEGVGRVAPPPAVEPKPKRASAPPPAEAPPPPVVDEPIVPQPLAPVAHDPGPGRSAAAAGARRSRKRKEADAAQLTEHELRSLRQSRLQTQLRGKRGPKPTQAELGALVERAIASGQVKVTKLAPGAHNGWRPSWMP